MPSMSSVYGRKVSLLLLVTSLESLLRPTMTSAHQEGAAVGQVGRGGAVTEASVSKSSHRIFVIHLPLNNIYQKKKFKVTKSRLVKGYSLKC